MAKSREAKAKTKEKGQKQRGKGAKGQSQSIKGRRAQAKKKSFADEEASESENVNIIGRTSTLFEACFAIHEEGCTKMILLCLLSTVNAKKIIRHNEHLQASHPESQPRLSSESPRRVIDSPIR